MVQLSLPNLFLSFDPKVLSLGIKYEGTPSRIKIGRLWDAPMRGIAYFESIFRYVSPETAVSEKK